MSCTNSCNTAAILFRPQCVISIISMAWCKTAVSPLLTHWRYCSIELNQRYLCCWQLQHDIFVRWLITLPVESGFTSLCFEIPSQGMSLFVWPFYENIIVDAPLLCITRYKHICLDKWNRIDGLFLIAQSPFKTVFMLSIVFYKYWM